MALKTIRYIKVTHNPFGVSGTVVVYRAYTTGDKLLDTIAVDLAHGEDSVDRLVQELSSRWRIETHEALMNLMK